VTTRAGLEPLPRGRHGLSREAVARAQRERLLVATARVTASRGYETTTVADILGEAGVGRETFYELIAKVEAAYVGPGDWVARCRATLAVLLDWFADDPEAGRFLLVELPGIGPEFHERFKAGFDRFVAVIESDLPSDLPDPGPLPTTSLAVGAAISRVYGEVAAGRSRELPLLLPQLTYEALVPFVGEAAARKAAFASV
jgi:hypothetical protein